MTRNPRSHTLLALAVTVAALSCGGSDNGTTDPSTTGSLRVTVNANGSGRSGVTVRRYASGSGSVAGTQTTGGDGSTTFSGVDAGTHDVEIDVPDGFSLNDGEAERKSETVTAGGTANVAFAISSDDAGDVVEITLSGTSFSSSDVTISPGTTIRWINQDGMEHTVTPEGHTEWSSESLSTAGQTFTHTFNTTGTFDYYCQPHLASGMTGVIRVE